MSIFRAFVYTLMVTTSAVPATDAVSTKEDVTKPVDSGLTTPVDTNVPPVDDSVLGVKTVGLGTAGETVPEVTNVVLISASDSVTVFDVEFGNPTVFEVKAEGRAFSRYDIPGCSATGETGTPELVMRGVWVAVPEGADVSVSVEDTDYSVIADVDLYPRPGEKVVERSGYESLVEDFVFDKGAYAKGPYPTRAAEVVGNADIRGLRVVRVGVYAYSYDPQKRVLRLYDKVRVKVSHPGGRTRAFLEDVGPYTGDGFDGALSRNILNYEIASLWPREGKTYSAEEDEIWAGQWQQAYKIIVEDTGFYHLSYDYLVGHGFDTSVDPRNLHLYAWNAEMLPKSLNEPVNGLEEIPFIVAGEGDGNFDDGDYIEFFGHGTSFFEDTGTQFIHKKHNYSNYNFYWLVAGDAPGLRYTTKDGTPSNPNVNPVPAFASRVHFEEERQYKGSSSEIGEDEEKWFWFTVLPSKYHEETFNIYGFDDTVTDLTTRFKFLLRSYPSGDEMEPHSTRIYINEMDDEHVVWELMSWVPGIEIEEDVIVENPDIFRDGGNYIYVEELGDKPEENHAILFSHFEVEYPKSYSARNDYLLFSNPPNRQGDIMFEVNRYSTDGLFVYDVTDGKIITGFEVEKTGTTYTFRFEDTIEEGRRWFVGCTDVSKMEPVDFYADEPSALRYEKAEDLLIITNRKFYDNLLPLANLRRSQGLSVGMYKVTDVFDEFSGGVLDPVAIRNFVKYRYENPATRPTYVLLVGDASYDYRDNYRYYEKEYRDFGGNLCTTMHIYSSPNGDSASDNFFSCVDGEDYVGDVFVGRLAARFENQVSNMVGKILANDRSIDLGTWRARSLLIADNDDKTGIEYDGGRGNFTRDYEVGMIPPYVPPGLGIDKMYIEWMNRAHPGFDYLYREYRRPLVREEMTPDLVEAFDALLVQYSGHGGPQIWSHEDLFVHGAHNRMDIDDLTNYSRYPIIMEMSCTNSKFDDIPLAGEPLSNECINEYFMHPAERGAVATTGSSRLGTESAQADYLEGFYMNLFPGQEMSDQPITVGEAFWGGKLFSDTTRLWIIYTLMGDPSMEVGVPKPSIRDVTVAPNPVPRGGILNVSGTVPGLANGNVEVSIYDKPYYFTSVQDGVGDVYRERLLSRVTEEVTAGRFDVDVPIPVTAGWGYGGEGMGTDIDDALVRVYAYDSGKYEDYVLPEDFEISIHGDADSGDTTGPVVDIFFDDYGFRAGDPVDTNPEMIMAISDPSGVLVSSYTEDIGVDFRPITYEIDNGGEIDVTRYFEPTVGDYRSGEVRRKVSFTKGKHEVTVKAFDNLMNETERTVEVTVAGDLALAEVYNCPNPFGVGGTYFTFVNSTYLDNAVVKVYTVTGKLVEKLEARNLPPGYNEIYWDGRDRDGDEIANGVYFYKIVARSGTHKCEIKQKLIKMR
jgi:hypothetical protein